MRLIDADKLEAHEQLSSLGNGMYEATFVVYKDDIDDQPTVDAVPVKHAHYIKGKDDRWYCSNCRRIDVMHSVARYCWYCGSRMDEERETE